MNRYSRAHIVENCFAASYITYIQLFYRTVYRTGIRVSSPYFMPCLWPEKIKIKINKNKIICNIS